MNTVSNSLQWVGLGGAVALGLPVAWPVFLAMMVLQCGVAVVVWFADIKFSCNHWWTCWRSCC